MDWRPGPRGALLISVLTLPLFLLGLAAYAWIATRAPATSEIRAAGLLLFLVMSVVLTALLLAAHEAVHGVTMRVFGARRPRVGWMLISKFLPALYTTASGHRFNRAEYLVVLAMPTIVISTLGALACLTPPGLIFVAPLAFHLSACAGDLVMIARVLREPRGTRCEDVKAGVRFYRPAPN